MTKKYTAYHRDDVKDGFPEEMYVLVVYNNKGESRKVEYRFSEDDLGSSTKHDILEEIKETIKYWEEEKG